MQQYDEHRFPYKWYLKDGYPAKGIEPHNSSVFGTFICGGGSSMGYKLAGFNHLGGVELDPEVAKVYKQNHNPEYLYNMDIREFNELQDLPAELYQLDLLDGSPPCSTFSTAGSRDKAWGKEKRFAEGQKLQTLDDLVFVYCDTILKLRPKCFLLENVSGIIKGNAKSYTKRICQYLQQNGYTVQVFCLNAATMGVPQRRERVFFIGHKVEYKLPKLTLDFKEDPILFREFADFKGKPIGGEMCRKLWDNRKVGDLNQSQACERLFGKTSNFGQSYAYLDKVVPTLTAHEDCMYHFAKPMMLSRSEWCCASTFPQDYNFEPKTHPFFIGMSVPPVMTAQIAYQIWKQWISNIHTSDK